MCLMSLWYCLTELKLVKVGLFLLYEMKHLFSYNCEGLSKDNGLAILNNMSGPKTGCTKNN